MAEHNMFHDPNNGYLGDFVEELPNGAFEPRKGRICDAHMWCPESDTWLQGQRGLGPDPMRHKEARWVSILVHEGGAIVVPDYTIRVVDPFPIRNDNMGLYFPIDEWVIPLPRKPEGVAVSLAGIQVGEEIATWGFRVTSDGDPVGLADWHSGTVAKISRGEDWTDVTFDTGLLVRTVNCAQTVAP